MKDEGEELIAMARGFASAAHINQKYASLPYTYHLEATAQVLREHGYGEQTRSFALLAGAWLHDVLEDTAITQDQLASVFGSRIAYLVWAVTDEPGENRTERKSKTLPKTSKFGEVARALKLADRIANVTYANHTGDIKKLDMYRKEHALFRWHLYDSRDRELTMSMWRTLEKALGV